jgi:exonuclease I
MTAQDDDYTPQNYQDEIDTDDNLNDRITQELTDDPTKELGVNPNEFRDELNKYVDEGNDTDNEDRREEIEDIDGDEEDRS